MYICINRYAHMYMRSRQLPFSNRARTPPGLAPMELVQQIYRRYPQLPQSYPPVSTKRVPIRPHVWRCSNSACFNPCPNSSAYLKTRIFKRFVNVERRSIQDFVKTGCPKPVPRNADIFKLCKPFCKYAARLQPLH